MPKLLYLITEDWFFCSHFLDRAVAARDAGYEVLVLTQVSRHGQAIRAAGLRLLPLNMDRGGLNPFLELRALWEVARVYRDERPDLIHHIALKPILLGSLAARLVGAGPLVNALVGMGFIFSSRGVLARALRPVLQRLLKLTLNPPGSRVVFENEDDLRDFVAMGLVRETAAVLIRGAGVDTRLFQPVVRVSRPPVVMLVARMLWDKGVGEFVAAAAMLKQRGLDARFVLVGAPDASNRAHIPESVLDRWQREGAVECWGARERMHQVLAEADIACLPSYREGLPKALLEAMAVGLPCVTTDVPGCRSVVSNGDNGFLVPARDVAALATALAKLIGDAGLRQSMGRRGRARAELEFANERVIAETLATYREILA
jgi:glycosyltransferase involved in cell wall biosynthesis